MEHVNLRGQLLYCPHFFFFFLSCSVLTWTNTRTRIAPFLSYFQFYFWTTGMFCFFLFYMVRLQSFYPPFLILVINLYLQLEVVGCMKIPVGLNEEARQIGDSCVCIFPACTDWISRFLQCGNTGYSQSVTSKCALLHCGNFALSCMLLEKKIISHLLWFHYCGTCWS